MEMKISTPERNWNYSHLLTTGALGYVFTTPCAPEYPMYHQLDVTLHAQPAERHYDPEFVRFKVALPIWGTEWIKVRHPWQRADEHHVLPSCVVIRDRVDGIVEAFTFGGELNILTEGDRTACTLESAAPIFPLNNGSSVSTIFAEEVEILLAERRAVWDVEHPRALFEERLAQVDSIDLYFACLERFQQVFSHYPFLQSESMLHFNHFIRSEIQSFRETHRWPLFVTPIEQLL